MVVFDYIMLYYLREFNLYDSPNRQIKVLAKLSCYMVLIIVFCVGISKALLVLYSSYSTSCQWKCAIILPVLYSSYYSRLPSKQRVD